MRQPPKHPTVTFEELTYSNMRMLNALAERVAENGLLSKAEILERVEAPKGDEGERMTGRSTTGPGRAFVIAALLGASLPTLAALQKEWEEKAIVKVQQLSVSKRDPKLRRERLAEWLERISAPAAKLHWEMNDCGEQTGTAADAGRDIPACVEGDAILGDGRQVLLMIAVGSSKRGMTGTPVLFFASVKDKAGVHSVRRLSELPKVLTAQATK